MILLLYLSIFLLGIGISGVITNRSIILTIFSIELILLASIIFLGYSLSYNTDAEGSEMILAIWAVAAMDAIVLVSVYFALKSAGAEFDVRKFSEFKG